jgi:hypothetical protein
VIHGSRPESALDGFGSDNDSLFMNETARNDSCAAAVGAKSYGDMPARRFSLTDSAWSQNVGPRPPNRTCRITWKALLPLALLQSGRISSLDAMMLRG